MEKATEYFVHCFELKYATLLSKEDTELPKIPLVQVKIQQVLLAAIKLAYTK